MYHQMKKISIVALICVIAITLGIMPNAFAQDSTVIGGVIGGGSNAGAAQNQSIDMGTNIGSDMARGRQFAQPGNVSFAPLINYFGEALPSSAFQPVEDIILYNCWYTEGALRAMLKDVEDVEAEMKIANTFFTPAAVATEDGKTRWIKVVVSRSAYAAPVDFIGHVTGRSDDKDTTSVEVVAKSALAALEAGANVIHFSAQGAVRDVESFGWGIGLSTTQASLHSNTNSDSNISTGGFGISGGKAGMRDKPWLQGFALVDHALVYPAIPMPEPVVEEVEEAPEG